ncbi:hypothetical protein KGD82_16680 [Nocardiopsis eucommiae]|uniref:Uncharacterized protein n=1 Tax=Nocardiopsis eucommiae TaxID=2831970 RepID=A0A975QJQ9_9ACTN|nr:hypothetical protein KGD82_16680 [Nocardiopsis eucommiae]
MEDEQAPGSWYVTRYGYRYLKDGSTVFQPIVGTQDEKDRARKASLMSFDDAMATAERLAPTLLDRGRKSPDQVPTTV